MYTYVIVAMYCNKYFSISGGSCNTIESSNIRFKPGFSVSMIHWKVTLVLSIMQKTEGNMLVKFKIHIYCSNILFVKCSAKKYTIKIVRSLFGNTGMVRDWHL